MPLQPSTFLPSEFDKSMLLLAIRLAKQAEQINEVPVGAVLVDSTQQIIASAHNQPITDNDPTAHAEILCLRQAGDKLNNYRFPETTLYSTLEPCPMCTGALIHARVKRVVFVAQDFRSGACGTALELANNPTLNHQLICEFYEDKGYIDLLQQFFKRRR